ncbi:U6 snRNA-associated Sm-like protein LSm6 [Nematocida major]|uniref:U6 snRNA-associated Sm-like protein LSm6 n=1 Tax=Nematocida major TaxID=1912982 RepID=UPI002008D7D3|nr:U6 snRNA-associated Sm-like protein LSm6 [Nematocida major]KAH9387221.1 U6 snRNA-associated Sm-like protein LSm6 [Nematocida major]
MKELSEFIHSPVSVKTYCNRVYTGTLLAVDKYLNIVLQSIPGTDNLKKGFVFIKGSNVLLFTVQ